MTARKPLTFGSLFAGIGGFDLGFERAGLSCKWQVEIDPFCRRVLKKHWPDVPRFSDVKEFPPRGVRLHEGRSDHPRAVGATEGTGGDDPGLDSLRVDVICGGDPCQGNSNAGSIYKRKHEDMGSELVRVVDALRPRVVVRENPYPSRPDALWPWWRMRAELERVGYRVLPFRLRACCVGADHRRDRVFLLGERADTDSQPVRVQGRSANAATAGADQGRRQERKRVRLDAATMGRPSALPHPDGYRLERLDGQGEPSGHVSGTGSGGQRRERGDGLPPPEICRGSDGIPHRVERTRALGNAVDVRVAEWIGRRLMEADA